MNKYKGFLLATASGVVLAPAAQAADLPMKGPAYAPIAAPSWQGWYVGLHAGVAWQQGENRVGGAGYTPDNTTFIGGGQIGFNWQKGNFVYGWEADISGLCCDDNQSTRNTTGYITYGNHISWLSTFRGRLGLAVNDTMVYSTFGLAVGGVDNTHHWGPGSPDYSTSKTRLGWTAGVGIEHMWSRNWSLALEGLFVDLGRYDGLKNNSTNRFSNQAMISRFKVNYRW